MSESIEIPDFSGDDFANDKQIKKMRADADAFNSMMVESIRAIKESFAIKNVSHKNLKGFGMFKALQPTINETLGSSEKYPNLTIILATYHSAYPIPRNPNSGVDYYLFGHIRLTKAFPNTYICKETIREKIANLVLKSDLDFDHARKFSSRFHVITEDKIQLSDRLQTKDLDCLSEYPDLEIEIYKQACLFRSSKKSVSPSEADSFCNLTKFMVKIFD